MAPNGDQKYWDSAWRSVQANTTKLMKAVEGTAPPFTAAEYMDTYTIIYNMSSLSSRYSKKLYKGYRLLLERYITHTILPSIEANQAAGAEAMLRDLARRWSNHKLMVRRLRFCFCYLDRYFIPSQNLATLFEVGLPCFRNIVYDTVKDEAVNAVVSLINHERRQEQPIDESALKDVSEFFVEIEAYYSDLEPNIIKAAVKYYRKKASTWLKSNSCLGYLTKATQAFNTEKKRISLYLQASTEAKLIMILRQELLEKHFRQLLEMEEPYWRELLRDNDLDVLSRRYKPFAKVEKGPEIVSQIFREYVTREGMDLVREVEDEMAVDDRLEEHVFVRKVLELNEKYLNRVHHCFQNHRLFHGALRMAFETFCNKTVAGGSSAEAIAAFTDDTLKKAGGDDEAVEHTLENIVRLIAYVNDKDLLFGFLRKNFARRLLFDRSSKIVYERSFLMKLKEHYGRQLTSKMEGMLTDMALSKEKQARFDHYLSDNRVAIHGTKLSVTVLTTGYWLSYKPSEINLPQEMVKYVEVFTKFYHANTKDRKLSWIHSLGSCTLVGKFASKTIKLIVSTYQASALLLFNDSDQLSYSEIESQLNLKDNENVLIRVLHSLSCGKYKLLKKVPDTKAISLNDYFIFNSEFTHRSTRIRVLLLLPDEKKKIIEQVDKDRRYTIDACLVRVMKRRKVLDYQLLVLECIEKLRCMFTPDVKMIKARIEDLLGRDFLERDAGNPSVLKYVA